MLTSYFENTEGTTANRFETQILRIAVVLVLSIALVVPAHAIRVKDIASIEGVRENQLVGYGLVTGLAGTGDSVFGAPYTIQSLLSMLNKLGVNLSVDPQQILARNVAGVMVTANLPAFGKVGNRIDAVVSSIGDAKSLQGGTLLITPLMGATKDVYAVAQGQVTIGGFLGGSDGNSKSKNHVTAGIISGGALVEREVPVDLNAWDTISINLDQQDFTTAVRLADTVNVLYGNGIATPVNPGVVTLIVPEPFRGRIVPFIAAIESLDVAIDLRARVVVNERTGTVVMGEHVRISRVAVSHGNLTVEVTTELEASQPEAPFLGSTGGETVVVPNVDTTVEEEPSRLMIIDGSATLGDVVRGLNAVGVTPRDLVSILQAIKAVGALHAELEVI